MAECTAVVHTRAGELVKKVLSLYCTSRFSESFIQKTVTSQGLHTWACHEGDRRQVTRRI